MFISSETEWSKLTAEILRRLPLGGVIGLSGGLGAGKTTFVRNFIETLSVRGGKKVPRVLSPSFVFRQSYPELSPAVEHFDLYRLENINEATLRELGVTEAIESAESTYVFIEWPEKILPGVVSFNLTVVWQPSETGRMIELSDKKTF